MVRCARCGRNTKTIGGRCPNCGAVKDPAVLPAVDHTTRRGPSMWDSLDDLVLLVVLSAPGVALLLVWALWASSGALLVVSIICVLLAVGGWAAHTW
jgi:hypothetical protein